MSDKPLYADDLELRVFFEGVLFPYVKSVNISDTPQNTQCRIEIPPSIKLRPEELAGMTCHIFYANKRVREKFGGHKDDVKTDWPILFQGEMEGFNHTKNVQSESVVLKFTSHARHFDQTILYFYDPAGSQHPINVENFRKFLGNIEFELDISGPGSYTTRVMSSLTERSERLSSTINTYRNIAFTSTILQILRNARGSHINFRRFDDRFNITKRFAAYADPDIHKMMSLDLMRTFIDGQMKAFGSQTPLSQIIQTVVGMLRYDFIHISQPLYRRAGEREGINQSKNYIDTGDMGEIILDRYESKEEFVAAVNRIPTSIFITEDQNVSGGYGGVENFYLDNINGGDFDMRKFLGIFRDYASLSDGFSMPERVFAEYIEEMMKSPGFYYDSSRSSIGDLSVDEEEGEASEDQTQSRIDQMISSPEEEGPETAGLIEQDQRELMRRDEINEFMALPNMDFAQPPKCNVIMPYSFRSYGMRRNLLNEPTRLYGKANIVLSGGDEGTTEWYLAPVSQAYYHCNEEGDSKFSDAYREYHKKIQEEE